MFQVLLCDDEPSITNFLRKNVPWESMGIENIYIANDGLEAISILESHTIHLLITDIRMPRMDGLTLLENVRQKYPDTRCILLTAYGEFEYAKAAFRLGVDNYLMKPIQIDELQGTIESAVENIYLSRKNREELFQENILRRWLSGTISIEELGERSNLLEDINIYQSSYLAVCMQKLESHISLSSFAKACAEQLMDSLDCLQVWDNQGYHVLIISGHLIDIEKIRAILSQTAISLQIDTKIKIAIGTIVYQCLKLTHSYQGAIKLLKQMNQESQLFLYIVSSENTSQTSESNFVYDELSPIVQKAIDYIHAEYAHGVSIREFCTKYTITPAYLGYLFKNETHTFFNNYLNKYRLEQATILLSQTQERINTIAEKTGFSTTSYFISSFKKYTGMSPQKYREQQYYETTEQSSDLI